MNKQENILVPCWVSKNECHVKECSRICRPKKEGETRDNINPKVMHQKKVEARRIFYILNS